MPFPIIAAVASALVGKKVQQNQEKAKRSKAAKKGAETRKANAAKKKG